MKRFIIILSSLALLLCGCSPKLSNGIKAESIPADHPDYAVIYFYRTSNFAATPYDVHLGNEVVYRSKNNTKAAVKVNKPGTYEIWGKTETREGITLNIEMGKEYYVRTYVKFGVALWRPKLELKTPLEAEPEWNSIR